VILTASAKALMPFSSDRRESSSNEIILAMFDFYISSIRQFSTQKKRVLTISTIEFNK
jgi:hypothetical protein